LREALQLETSRRLAAGRLAAARAFMQQLARERDASDIPAEDLA
jgi:hypothetical protein